jgi:hypothetical protein
MRIKGGSGFDLRPWSDVRYPATIEKYKLRDIQEAKHLCPKLYFEPRGSSEEEVVHGLHELDRAWRAVAAVDGLVEFAAVCTGACAPLDGLKAISLKAAGQRARPCIKTSKVGFALRS